jgi:regulator of protease activity HflC (stomatin/prohibitin superfamily)
MDDQATLDQQDSATPPIRKWSIGWINQYIHKRKRGFIIGVLVGLLIFLFFAERVVIFVDAGETAVLFKRFRGGTQLEKTFGEGLHIVLPWDHMEVYNVRIQHEYKQFEVLSANGLKILVDASIRYRPILENLPDLHQNVGPDYADRIVFPEVEAVVRQIFGQYLPEDIYSSQKFIIQNTVQNAIFEVSERFVDLDELLITRITLPDMIVTAIEEKLEKEQIALGYQFRLDSERLEAERKRIEASGIHDFQTIISAGLTENYLRFKGIEATLKLAESDNSKIVVIGGGKDGLPIILDGSADRARVVN